MKLFTRVVARPSRSPETPVGKDVTQNQPANIYGLAPREGPTQILARKATRKGQGALSSLYIYIYWYVCMYVLRMCVYTL